MATTKTGKFPIGFRRGNLEWQKNLDTLAGWAATTGFECLDLINPTAADLATLQKHKLRIGTADLIMWRELLSPDTGKRKDAVDKASVYIKDLSEKGARRFFTIAMPEDPARNPAENFNLLVESYSELNKVAVACNAKLLFEGWPGGKGLPNLMCTPESCRAIFKALGSAGLGINYDPSHLIRLGIDHIRFAQEFAEYIGHVHAKDTEIIDDKVYELGLYQPGIFERKHDWGEYVWRYCLPGHGCTRWTKLMQILVAAGFDGAVSIELEDERFNGSEDGEKTALRASLAFLESV